MHIEIRVKGALDSMWSAWFDGPQVASDDVDETIISGRSQTRRPCHSQLTKVRDLGLELLEVRRIDPEERHGSHRGR